MTQDHWCGCLLIAPGRDANGGEGLQVGVADRPGQGGVAGHHQVVDRQCNQGTVVGGDKGRCQDLSVSHSSQGGNLERTVLKFAILVGQLEGGGLVSVSPCPRPGHTRRWRTVPVRARGSRAVCPPGAAPPGRGSGRLPHRFHMR